MSCRQARSSVETRQPECRPRIAHSMLHCPYTVEQGSSSTCRMKSHAGAPNRSHGHGQRLPRYSASAMHRHCESTVQQTAAAAQSCAPHLWVPGTPQPTSAKPTPASAGISSSSCAPLGRCDACLLQDGPHAVVGVGKDMSGLVGPGRRAGRKGWGGGGGV